MFVLGWRTFGVGSLHFKTLGALLWTLPHPRSIWAGRYNRKLLHLVSNCDSQRLQNQSRARCERSNDRFSFSLSDHHESSRRSCSYSCWWHFNRCSSCEYMLCIGWSRQIFWHESWDMQPSELFHSEESKLWIHLFERTHKSNEKLLCWYDVEIYSVSKF